MLCKIEMMSIQPSIVISKRNAKELQCYPLHPMFRFKRSHSLSMIDVTHQDHHAIFHCSRTNGLVQTWIGWRSSIFNCNWSTNMNHPSALGCESKSQCRVLIFDSFHLREEVRWHAVLSHHARLCLRCRCRYV